jgi:hypothetical protein
MKNSHETLGNRIRDLPTFSAVPQPTEPGYVVYGSLKSLIVYSSLAHTNRVIGGIKS